MQRHVSFGSRIAGPLMAASALCLAAPVFARQGPPNIILVVIDDQRHDSLGVVNPAIQTPALDRLANEGAHFVNGFVTTSLCSPSRASILTGKQVRNHRVFDNNMPLPEGTRLVAESLKTAGYTTAFIGKWHMGGEDASPKPGFDRWVSFPGQGNYGPTDMLGRPSRLNIDGREEPQKGYITDELTDHAVDWLQGKGQRQPFFLVLSHKGLHAPFRPADRHARLYEGLSWAPPSADSDPAWTPMWVRAQQNSWHGRDFAYHSGWNVDDWRRQYLRTLASIDESVARLVASVEAQGLSKETILIYTSDNGFLEGEKGLIDKRTAYEPSIRVPMLVWGPGRVAPGRREQMVLNIDIAPTIVDLAGLPPDSSHDGASFRPFLSAEAAASPGRDRFTYEYFWEYNYPYTPTTFALRTARYKYIQYQGVWDVEELFDLKSDPGETRNLIADPASAPLVRQFRADLYRDLADRKGGHEIPYGVRVNQGAVFRRAEGPHPLGFPAGWLRQPGAPDRYEHVLPDGPDKPNQLERLNRALSGNPTD